MHRCCSSDRDVRMEYLVQSYKDCFHQLPDHTAGSISKANDNLSIKLSEVSLDNLDRLTGYDMVFINGMGLRIVEEQRQQIQQAADKGIPVYTSMATNPANNICNLTAYNRI